jgi:hypothetical protein
MLTLNGPQRHTYSETKRMAIDRNVIYMADMPVEKIVRIGERIPIKTPRYNQIERSLIELPS